MRKPCEVLGRQWKLAWACECQFLLFHHTPVQNECLNEQVSVPVAFTFIASFAVFHKFPLAAIGMIWILLSLPNGVVFFSTLSNYNVQHASLELYQFFFFFAARAWVHISYSLLDYSCIGLYSLFVWYA